MIKDLPIFLLMLALLSLVFIGTPAVLWWIATGYPPPWWALVISVGFLGCLIDWLRDDSPLGPPQGPKKEPSDFCKWQHRPQISCRACDGTGHIWGKTIRCVPEGGTADSPVSWHDEEDEGWTSCPACHGYRTVEDPDAKCPYPECTVVCSLKPRKTPAVPMVVEDELPNDTPKSHPDPRDPYWKRTMPSGPALDASGTAYDP